MQTILIGPGVGPGQATTCPSAPCIDPGFAAVGGPTAPYEAYWSASTVAGASRTGAWYAVFFDGHVDLHVKTSHYYVRAVRAGSCN